MSYIRIDENRIIEPKSGVEAQGLPRPTKAHYTHMHAHTLMFERRKDSWRRKERKKEIKRVREREEEEEEENEKEQRTRDLVS